MDIIDILKSKDKTMDEFVFENLTIPPMWYYLSPQDVENLRKIATSLRLSSRVQEKYRMIDNIMRARGFRRFSRGTNRVVYSYLEDTRFVVKIAVDKVGMQDNPSEFRNQQFLQPFVTKMFYVSPCGTVGFAERVKPIANIDEFREIAEDVFNMLVYKILGEYVVEDCGNKFFKNYGIRLGCGPVLLDYPYVYKLDGSKLVCNYKDPKTGIVCGGDIEYDDGLNYLLCQKCGRKYLASDLKDNNNINKLVNKGGNKMKVKIIRGKDTLVSNDINVDEVMVKREAARKENIRKSSSIGVRIIGGGCTGDIEYPKAVIKSSKPSVSENSQLSVKVVGGNPKGTISRDALHSGDNRRSLDLNPDSTLKASVVSNTSEKEETAEEILEQSKELHKEMTSTINEIIDTLDETIKKEETAEEVNTEEVEESKEDETSEVETDEEVEEKEETTEAEEEPVVEEEEIPKKTTRKKADPTSKRSIKKSEKKAIEIDEPSIDEDAYNDIVEKTNETISKRTKTRKSMKKMIEDEEMEDMKIIKAKKTSKTRKASSKSNFIPSKE